MTASSPAPLRHRRLSTPVGDALLVASDRGIVACSFRPEETLLLLDHSGHSLSNRRHSSDSSVASDLLEEGADQIGDYFKGERNWFALPLDLLPTLPPQAGVSGARASHADASPFVSPTAPFLNEVQLALLRIPYGETRTYGQVAEEVGRPGAARAVGTACARNPIALIIPCHRVTRAKGGIGHYTGGSAIKQALLDLEASHKQKG